MVIFENVLRQWAEIGVFDVLLPFILVTTVVYALLQRTKILGKTKAGDAKKNINILTSILLAFFVVATAHVTQTITRIAQFMALAAVILVVVVMIFGFSGAKLEEMQNRWLLWSIGLVLFGTVALYALGWWEWVSLTLLNRYVIIPVLMLITFLIIVWFIAGEERVPEEAKAAAGEPAKPGQEPTSKHEAAVPYALEKIGRVKPDKGFRK